MQHLFSESGVQRLDEFAGAPLLCAFDFDGTLAPIVSRPEQARMPEDVGERLRALSGYAPLAVITGRSVEDIRSRLGSEPDFLIGNHGMEGVPGMDAHAARHAQQCAAWRTQLAEALADAEGVEIEDKRYSLSVHYRHAPQPATVAEKLREVLNSLRPAARIVDGKYVFNVVPPDALHKGTALEKLMVASGVRNALYVGDDVTDEDVFRLRRPDLLSVRIESSARSAADYFLQSQSDIIRLLDELLLRLRASGNAQMRRTPSTQS